jgi:nucleotide-binding universal stress UspA family protein
VDSGEQAAFELGTDGPSVILVGADDSTTAARAGWYALGLARRQRAKLVALFVSPVSSVVAAGPGGAALTVAKNEALAEVARDMKQRAEQAAAEFGISLTFLVRRGEPFTEICRAADEFRADAIVVGASAKAGHRFVGSLAIRLVRAGKWPVTVVP